MLLIASLVALVVTSRATDWRMYKCEILTPDVETTWMLTSEDNVFLVSWQCEGGTEVDQWVISVQGEKGVIREERARIIDPGKLRRIDWYIDVPYTTDPGEYRIIVMSWGQDDMALLNNKVQIMRKVDTERKSGKTFVQPSHEQVVSQTIEKQEKRKERLKQYNMTDYRQESRSNLKVMETPTQEERLAALAEGKPFILTGMMESWRCMERWQFSELEREKRLSMGIDMQIPGVSRVDFSKWNRYRQRYIPGNVEENEYLEMNDFFEYYPTFFADIESADHILGTRNFLSVVDEDVFMGTKFELCPARSGIEWRVSSFNSSQVFLQVVGERRFGLFPKETLFVPGYHHNSYRKAKKVSHPLNYWTHTLPALADSGRPHYDVVLKPGEILYVPSGYWLSSLCLEDTVGTVMDVCHALNIRECLDELRDQSDSALQNYYGNIFVQLREKLGKDLDLSNEDYDFVSPLVDNSLTFEKLEKDYDQKGVEYLTNASKKESIRYEEVLEDIFQPRPLNVNIQNENAEALNAMRQKDEL